MYSHSFDNFVCKLNVLLTLVTGKLPQITIRVITNAAYKPLKILYVILVLCLYVTLPVTSTVF